MPESASGKNGRLAACQFSFEEVLAAITMTHRGMKLM
jgi:hypothetical protein